MNHIYEATILIDQVSRKMADALENADCGIEIKWIENCDQMEQDPRGIYQLHGTFMQNISGGAVRTAAIADTISRFAIGWIRGVLEAAQPGGSEVTIHFSWKRVHTEDLPGDFSFSYVPDVRCLYCGWSPEMRGHPLDEDGYCIKHAGYGKDRK